MANVLAGFDLDSVAGIIWCNGRYLLQHREDRPDISHPDKLCLFGGAREQDETAESALKREMMEELEFAVSEVPPFLNCVFETHFDGRRTRKFFFDIRATKAEARSMVLHEGQGMTWLTFEETLAKGHMLVPFDLGAITMHHGWLAQQLQI